MKKFGKRLDLDRFNLSPSQEQKIGLSLRKKKSKNEKTTAVTPSLAPFAKYGNAEFQQDQIETRNIDFAFNPEDYGIYPITSWVMQRNMQNTPQPGLVAQNLSMKPQRGEEMSLSPYPHVERCTEPEKMLLLTNHNAMPLPISSAQADRRTEQQMTQPGFVNPNYEMVEQRYENISPPPSNSQSEMCISSRNEVPPVEAAEDSPSPPPGYISEVSLPIGMVQQNQHFEQPSYAQNVEMAQQSHDIPPPSTSGCAQYLPPQNMGMGAENIGITQQNIGQTPQSKFVQPQFEMDRRSYCPPRPIMFPQTEMRTQPETRVLYPEAAAATGNIQYVPFNNIEKIEDVRKMHQNITQSQETFTQTFNMNQQSLAGMAQPRPYAQPPTYINPNMYNARVRHPSRYYYQQPQFFGSNSPRTPLPPYQPQQIRPNIANTPQQHPNYAPRYQLYNQKQMQRPTTNYSNKYYNQHGFKYDDTRSQQGQQQQQQQQQQRQQQQQQQQRPQQPNSLHFSQQRATQKSYTHDQYYAQNIANSTCEPNIMTQQQHQPLLHRIEMHQRSYEYYQYYEQQNNTKR